MVAQLRPGGAEQVAWDEAVGALLSRVAYLRHLTGAHRPAAVLHAGVVLVDLQVCHAMPGHLPFRQRTCHTKHALQVQQCVLAMLTLVSAARPLEAVLSASWALVSTCALRSSCDSAAGRQSRVLLCYG